jgi:hypothetical protein
MNAVLAHIEQSTSRTITCDMRNVDCNKEDADAMLHGLYVQAFTTLESICVKISSESASESAWVHLVIQLIPLLTEVGSTVNFINVIIMDRYWGFWAPTLQSFECWTNQERSFLGISMICKHSTNKRRLIRETMKLFRETKSMCELQLSNTQLEDQHIQLLTCLTGYTLKRLKLSLCRVTTAGQKAIDRALLNNVKKRPDLTNIALCFRGFDWRQAQWQAKMEGKLQRVSDQKRMQAFALGLHQRLGMGTCIPGLSDDVLYSIWEYVATARISEH